MPMGFICGCDLWVRIDCVPPHLMLYLRPPAAGEHMETNACDSQRFLRALVRSEKPQTIITKPIRRKTDPRVVQMLALAKEMGFYCTSGTKWTNLLAKQILGRLCPRVGTSIYQVANFNLPIFPFELASQIFTELDQTEGTPLSTTQRGRRRAWGKLRLCWVPSFRDWTARTRALPGRCPSRPSS